MSDQNWRESLERAAMLWQRESNSMPSTAELLAKMARAGELDFLDATTKKEGVK
ncbi:hypothetical protein [Pseudomonas sp.]|uniref:hypothetical protein n=1 Tax=Pseudomonas sp. TaxID=306 RepID=UPI0033427346